MINQLKIAIPWFILLLLLMGLALAIYFNLHEYLSFTALKNYHTSLFAWSKQHYLLAVITYIVIYILVISISLPGGAFLTIIGGFLFGPVAIIYVILSATIGATIVFLTVKSTFGKWISRGANKWVKKMENGFNKNAFSYLLFLRFVPLFPFFAVNIVAGLLSVPFKTFVIATLFGIIPGTAVYTLLGNGLNEIFATNQTPNLNIIFTPSLFFPLLGLAILSLLPIFFKRWKRGNL